MSTISEALKKVQERRQESAPLPVPPTVPTPVRNEPSRPGAAPPATDSPTANSSLTVVIVLVLCLGLVGVIVWSRHDPGTGRTPSPATVESVPATVVTETVTKVVAPVIVTQMVQAVEAPPAKPVPPPADLPSLNGVFYSEQNPVAIINGATLKEGETIDRFTVFRILPRGVVLKSGGNEYELRLK